MALTSPGVYPRIIDLSQIPQPNPTPMNFYTIKTYSSNQKLYVAEYRTFNNSAILAWFEQTFGPSKHRQYGASMRIENWYHQNDRYYFANEADRTAFILRWS